MPRNPQDGATRQEVIKTAGEIFSDGTVLELIRDTSGDGGTSLLRWDGESATSGPEFEINGKVYRPPQFNSTSLRALRLPSHTAPYGSTRDLFNDIHEVFTQYTDFC
jgi:hypothetical protein